MDATKFTPCKFITCYTTKATMRLRLLWLLTEQSRIRPQRTERWRNMVFIDEEGEEVQVTIYDQDIEKYGEMLKEGRVYTIANLQGMPLDNTYKYVRNDIRMKFGRETKIVDVSEDLEGIPKYNFNFIQYESAPQHMGNSRSERLIDVIGLVLFVGPLQSVNERIDNNRRQILLCNTQKETLKLTLWGELAIKQGNILFHDRNNYHVLAVSLVKVVDYYGICLSTVARSRMFIDPDISETNEIDGWYAEDGEVQKHITRTQTMANSVHEMEILFHAKRVTLSQIHDEHKVKYFCVRAQVESIESELPIWYDACVRHSRKIGTCPHCGPTAAETTSRFRVPIKMNDGTATVSSVLFGHNAEMITGFAATEIKEWAEKENGDALMKQHLKQREQLSFVFVLHAPVQTTSEVIVAAVFEVKWEDEYKYLQEKTSPNNEDTA